jgi:hypothetical protein
MPWPFITDDGWSEMWTFADPSAIGWTVTINDTAHIADGVTTLAAFQRAIADGLTVTEALAYARTLSATDAITVTEGLTTSLGVVRALADNSTVTEQQTFQSDFQRALAEPVTVADARRTSTPPRAVL